MEFLEYNQLPQQQIPINETSSIASFIIDNDNNIDEKTIQSFGDEWTKFNSFTKEEICIAGSQYFDIVKQEHLNKNTNVLDLGCGSGRWTKFIASRVKLVEAIDPSDAVLSAFNLNQNEKNVRVTRASVANIPFADESFDFVVCLGVLHHIPDTKKALLNLVKKMKMGGYVLLYIYYNLDNRGVLYKWLYKGSVYPRIFISKMPKNTKKLICDLIAVFIYLPLICIAKSIKFIFPTTKIYKKWPLSYYIGKSFNIIRNDALDRFGTPLEQRFSKNEIANMMKNCGLSEIKFSENAPFWHVLGKRVI
ncbi:MAG: class I SAM-dependent methyltransferase [Flavobacteriales bacterium]|nr:class I SAM-dependent methyltransferase [Flavobacteriales bacterium]